MIESIVTVSEEYKNEFDEKLGCVVEQMQHDGLTVEIQYDVFAGGGGEYNLDYVYTALVIGRRNNG